MRDPKLLNLVNSILDTPITIDNTELQKKINEVYDTLRKKSEVSKSEYSRIFETTNDNLKYIFVDVPGFNKSDLNVELSDDNILTITGNSSVVFFKNRSVNETINIDKNFKIDSIELQNGVLAIFLKQVEPKSKKLIIN